MLTTLLQIRMISTYNLHTLVCFFLILKGEMKNMNNENFGIAYGGGLVRNKKVSKGELLSFGTGIKG